MRVVVYSHVRLFRESLADVIKDCQNVAEVHICECLDALVKDVLEFAPDVVLLDITVEAVLSEACLLNETCPQVHLLALATAETANDVIACADAGFIGYVPYDASLKELCAIMHHAQKGEFACHPKIANSLFREVRRRRSRHTETDPDEPLSHRESEVLALIACGKSNKEIARELVLSVATIKNHVHNTFTKLHVRCRTEACARLRNEPWLAGSAQTYSPKLKSTQSH